MLKSSHLFSSTEDQFGPDASADLPAPPRSSAQQAGSVDGFQDDKAAAQSDASRFSALHCELLLPPLPPAPPPSSPNGQAAELAESVFAVKLLESLQSLLAGDLEAEEKDSELPAAELMLPRV